MAGLNLTSLASPSTSSANNNSYVYDVFINHRGPDCKETFAMDLYRALSEQHGLRVFLDQPELQEGDNITPQIESAIRTARVHIAIFSPRYAESAWCLNELVLMLESRTTIIPVFYGVRPSELRWTQGETGLYGVLCMLLWVLCILCFTREENGAYARSLRTLEEKKTIDSKTGKKKPRYESNTIRKWRETLAQVADIKGFDKETCNGDERQLLKQVVEGVLKKVPREYHVAKYPIALDQKVEDFERKMLLQEQSGRTRVIGIVGLGGVGKTTLAKEIFNRHGSNYKRSCFLFDVRDKSLNSLQSMLLKDLVHLNEQINSIDEGKAKVTRYLPSSKALVILDDVDHIDQMDALLLSREDLLLSGSLILVTSRNKDVLTSWGIDESSIYSLTGLVPQHSKELFCSHAFGRPHPDVGFDEVVEEFVVACHGLPLSLKVLGALVRGKNDLNHWKEQLLKISEVLPSDIQQRLKISYNSLDEEEKQIFLDIACFFTGEDRDTTIRILDGSGWRGCLGLRNLENRCLLEVDNENHIRMHDHLRDLGRSIAEKEPPDCLRRLWRPTDNLHNLSDFQPVRGISMAPNYGSEWRTPQSFQNLAEFTCRLRLLKAEGDYVKSILRIAQSPQLIWLHWEDCPYSSLPSWIPTENLRVLKINGGHLETLWLDESKAPVQMRELIIRADLLNIPKSIGNLKHLEKFFLFCYPGELASLKTVPDEFCNLQSLKHLALRQCSAMESLPDSLGNLTNLQSINLSSCSGLQMLPDSLGNCTSLQTIDLYSCSGLQMLPDSLGNCTSLHTINLSYCSGLQMLPDSLSNCTSLQTIDLSHCSGLQKLPDSLGNCTSLQTIDLSRCSGLQKLPDSLGNCTSLQTIRLDFCSGLQMLPDSLGNCTSLQTIHLDYCSGLQMLPDSLGNCTSLQTINLSYCSGLQMLPDSLGNCTSLQTIYLNYCSGLQMLPDSLGNCTSLQTIDLYDCSRLQMLPDSFGNFTSLQTIHMIGCSRLQMLPDSLGNCTSLHTIYLSYCSSLQMLPDSLGNCTSLHTIYLPYCSRLQMLPESLGNCTSLKTIDLSGCYCLQMLPESLGNCTSLQTIDLSGCSRLQTLPDSLGNCTSLQTIDMPDCSGLQTLPDSLGNCTSLQTINMSGCSGLQMLPNSLGNCTSLQIIDLFSCSGWRWSL